MHEKLFADAGLSLDRLKTFVEIVASGGINLAANGDANRQSQFSRQLKELEEFFGTELARRGRGHFALTPIGTRLHELAQMYLAALNELRQDCEELPIELRLGAGESLIQWLVFSSLSKFKRAVPNVTFVLKNLQTKEILRQLVHAQIDLGIVRTEAVPKSLRHTRLFTLEYRIFSPIDARLLKSNETAELIKSRPWAVLEGDSRTTRALREEADKCGVRLDEQIACSSFTQAAEAVQVLGVSAILPAVARTIFDGTKTAELSPLFLTGLASPLSMAWNPRVERIRPMLGRAVRELAQTMRSSGGKFSKRR